jgi:putative addiction module CopG family antidote
MATRTTLNVSLPVELGRFVETLVAEGSYASSSEVVRAALRLLRDREAERAGHLKQRAQVPSVAEKS